MANTKKSVPQMESDAQEYLEKLETTASQIRYLNSLGYSRGDISRILNIKYQWVRNVLITPLKN